jgi:hypothetical protein
MKGGKKSLGRGWQLRLIVAVILGGWMAFAPAYRQVFDGDSDWFPRWVMFHGFGRNVCDVTFFEVSDQGGKRTKVDRFEVLELSRSWSNNKSLVRMDNKKAVASVGRRLCRALGPGTDLRAIARCGSRSTWKTKFDGKTNLCRRASRSRSLKHPVLPKQ